MPDDAARQGQSHLRIQPPLSCGRRSSEGKGNVLLEILFVVRVSHARTLEEEEQKGNKKHNQNANMWTKKTNTI